MVITGPRGIPSLTASLGARLVESVRRRITGGPRIARATFVPPPRDLVQPRG